MKQKVFDWFDHRTGYRGVVQEALFERIPGGARWRYVWGSTLVFTFSVQMMTGIVLWASYAPSATSAWESVYYIQNELTLGWLVRGIHHFAAQAMVVLMALHLMQVIIDGAYRAPREINFWLGLILMQIVLGLSLTGYLLPWDQKGYYATQVSTEIMGATPVIGTTLQQVLQGGAEYGHLTLTRFFALHAGVLPASLVVFLIVHIYVFRRHGITVPKPDRAPEASFWPDQILKDAVACLAVLATVLFLAVYKGAELSAPANPAESYSAARPEWYFLFLFRFLKFEAVEHFGLAFGAIYVPGALFLVLALMPIIAYVRYGHAFNVLFTFVMLVAIVALTALAIYEDSNDENHQIAVEEALRDGERTAELARAFGIPPEGAQALRRDDPLSQGPRIFAANCASCHRFNGHDGTGREILEVVETIDAEGQSTSVEKIAEPTAADLGNFGTRDWVESVLVDYKTLFAPLANASWDGEPVGPAFLEEGDMVYWVEENKETLTSPANKQSLAALVEFLVAQSGRTDIPAPDPELVAQGREIFMNGTLAEGELTSSCVDCHSMHARGEEEPIAEDGYGPTLTGYGGQEWLNSFVNNPAAHYGDKNAMPAFADRLSQSDLALLNRWLTGDYYRPDEETPVATAEVEEEPAVEVQPESSEAPAESSDAE